MRPSAALDQQRRCWSNAADYSDSPQIRSPELLTYLTTNQPIYSKKEPTSNTYARGGKIDSRGFEPLATAHRHIILTRYPLGYRVSAGGGAADGMSKDYSDVTRMSVTDPNQFILRMLWPGSGAASLRSAGTAVCRAGDGQRAADGRHAGCNMSRHTLGSRDGTGPVTPQDPGTGRHRSYSGTPERDGTGHTPGLRDGTAPVTLRDPGTGRAPVTLRDS